MYFELWSEVVPLGHPLLSALDGMGYGGILLNDSGLLRINETAARLLSKRHPSLDLSKIDLAECQRALEGLLHLAGITGATLNEDNWTPVQPAESKASHPLIIRIIPLENAT